MVLMRGATSQARIQTGGRSAGAMMLHLKIHCVKKKKKKVRDKWLPQIFFWALRMSRELYFWFKQFHRIGSCPGADFMKSLLLQRYKFTSLFEGRGALKQLITSSINIHSILYLKSSKLGWDIESYYMKTVIWVSHLVQRKYQRLLKWSLEYVVHVDGNWMLRYLNNTRIAIVYCLPFLSLVMHFLYSTPLFNEHLVYFVFLSHTHTIIDTYASHCVWPTFRSLLNTSFNEHSPNLR